MRYRICSLVGVRGVRRAVRLFIDKSSRPEVPLSQISVGHPSAPSIIRMINLDRGQARPHAKSTARCGSDTALVAHHDIITNT